MPHASFKLVPGVDQNKTPALNEAAISYSQLVRFISDRTLGGLVQKLGGWTKFFGNSIGSKVRCLWGWEDTNAKAYLGVGADGIAPATVSGASGTGSVVTLTLSTPFKFTVGNSITVSGIIPTNYNGSYVVTASTLNSVSYAGTTTASYISGGTVAGGGGSLLVIKNATKTSQDITPQTTLRNTSVKFQTTINRNEVIVTDVGSNTDNYDSVYIKTQIAVGGIVLFGLYQIYNSGASADTYSIYATDLTGNPDNALFSTVASPISVTGASGTGTFATITFSTSYTFPVGSIVNITGINPSGYNGNYVVYSSTTNSVTFRSTTTSAYVSGGLLNNYGDVPLYTATAGSDFVNVTLPNHNLDVGLSFPVLVPTTIGDTGITLDGNYIVTAIVSDSVFTISASVSASASSTVLTAYENGGQVQFLYYNGLGPIPQGTGYGINAYGLGGYGTGTAPTANTGTPINASDWTLDNWGETLIACPLNGPIYQWNPTSGNLIALVIPEAPPINAGMFVAMPQRQIITWGSTYTGIQDPMQVRWCDVDNYNSWILQLTNQAGGYRIPKGSRIVQGIQAGQQGLLWTDLGLWAMQYVGLPYVYQFNELGTGCGLIGRKAAGSMAGTVYWMGQSQFYKLSGNGVEPIRCPIWDVIFQDLDTNALDRIRFGANSRFGEIRWDFPTKANGGEVSHYIKYNVWLDQWDFGTNSTENPYVSRTAWTNESVLGPPIGAGTNNYIYQHETSSDADGTPMYSSFQTGYFALNEADVKTFIDQVWPDMKWGYYDGNQTANIKLTFYTADYPGQTPNSYGPFTLTQATTYVTPRFRGRLVSIKIESQDIGSFWRLGNMRYRFQPDGKY
jgi:hypothetical protein